VVNEEGNTTSCPLRGPSGATAVGVQGVIRVWKWRGEVRIRVRVRVTRVRVRVTGG